MGYDERMSNKREKMVEKLLGICRTLAEHSDGRVALVHAEKDECQDPEMEAAHFLKLDGQRLGRDIELLGFIADVAGVEMALVDFAHGICLLKAKGLRDAYEAVRQDCSDLEEFMEGDEDRARWRDIFSIPAKSEITD
jgi:hypothetical protein